MAGGHVVCLSLLGPLQQAAELEIAIAGDARIWRAAAKVLLRERFDDGFDELRTQIQKLVRNPQELRDLLGAAMVGTNARAEPSFPHTQRHALHVVALLHQQARCDRTVDAAAHGNDNLWLSLTHQTLRSFLFQLLNRTEPGDATKQFKGTLFSPRKLLLLTGCRLGSSRYSTRMFQQLFNFIY